MTLFSRFSPLPEFKEPMLKLFAQIASTSDSNEPVVKSENRCKSGSNKTWTAPLRPNTSSRSALVRLFCWPANSMHWRDMKSVGYFSLHLNTLVLEGLTVKGSLLLLDKLYSYCATVVEQAGFVETNDVIFENEMTTNVTQGTAWVK